MRVFRLALKEKKRKKKKTQIGEQFSGPNEQNKELIRAQVQT
jgi:hypothetical protein